MLMLQKDAIDKILKVRLSVPEYALITSLISSVRAQVEQGEQQKWNRDRKIVQLECTVADEQRSVNNYKQWLKESYANVERKREEIIALEAEVTRLKVEAPKRGKEFCEEIARKEKVILDVLAKAREFRKGANEKMYALETEARVQKQHERLSIHSTYGKFESADSLRASIAWKDRLLAERLTTIQNLQKDVLTCGERLAEQTKAVENLQKDVLKWATKAYNLQKGVGAPNPTWVGPSTTIYELKQENVRLKQLVHNRTVNLDHCQECLEKVTEERNRLLKLNVDSQFTERSSLLRTEGDRLRKQAVDLAAQVISLEKKRVHDHQVKGELYKEISDLTQRLDHQTVNLQNCREVSMKVTEERNRLLSGPGLGRHAGQELASRNVRLAAQVEALEKERAHDHKVKGDLYNEISDLWARVRSAGRARLAMKG